MGGLVRKALLCHTGSREAGTSRGGKKAGMRDGRPESRPSQPADPLCDISERGAVVVAGTVYSQVPRESSARAFLTSRVPDLDFSQGLPDIPDTGGQMARGTYLGTRAAKAVHQALWLQVGVPALARGVFLPVEKAEHIWAWQTNQCCVSPRRLQPKTRPHPSFWF